MTDTRTWRPGDVVTTPEEARTLPRGTSFENGKLPYVSAWNEREFPGPGGFPWTLLAVPGHECEPRWWPASPEQVKDGDRVRLERGREAREFVVDGGDQVDGDYIRASYVSYGWTLFLDREPEPIDPDADLVTAMAIADYRARLGLSDDAPVSEDTIRRQINAARAVLAVVREWEAGR